jgi:hypothetical protein
VPEIFETQTPEVFLVPLTEIPAFEEPQSPPSSPVPSILSQLPVQPIRNSFAIPKEEEEEVVRPRQPPQRPPVQQKQNPPQRQPIQQQPQPQQQQNQEQHRVPILQQLQPVEPPRTRAPLLPRPVTTPQSVSSSDYDYVYEYEDGTSAVAPAPKPVKTIDDYDLVPLSQKVILKYIFSQICKCKSKSFNIRCYLNSFLLFILNAFFSFKM